MSARTFVQVIAVVAPRRNAVGATRMMPTEVAGHAARARTLIPLLITGALTPTPLLLQSTSTAAPDPDPPEGEGAPALSTSSSFSDHLTVTVSSLFGTLM